MIGFRLAQLAADVDRGARTSVAEEAGCTSVAGSIPGRSTKPAYYVPVRFRKV